MYAGKFNLNLYLRSFIRGDLVDSYEEECLRVVNKYRDISTNVAIEDMFRELNDELSNLVKTIREDQRKQGW